MQMKNFLVSLFTTLLIFTITPVYLPAQTDKVAIERVKTEAEAKELKRQAAQEINKRKEVVKARNE
jgi:hypothetical protein